MPGATMVIRTRECSAPSGSISTAVAATASCPSRNTVASIGTGSPTTAFAGQRPASTTGLSPRTGIRPASGRAAGTGGPPATAPAPASAPVAATAVAAVRPLRDWLIHPPHNPA
jgi:hypothetical protein